jgi:hypothetical protein
MVRIGGIPVFDGLRMTADQIWETEERLERITGRAEQGSVKEAVSAYMEAYGRFGLRVQDVVEAIDASKPIVLRYLRQMVEVGTVRVKEEKTRGNGSPRKRYIWMGNELAFGGEVVLTGLGTGGVHVKNDDWWRKGDGSGIIHHGTSQGEFSGCKCHRCSGCIAEGLVAEAVSEARQAGETGFAELIRG